MPIVDKCGTGNAVQVLLLPSLPGDSRIWRQVQQLAPPTICVSLFDYPGTGGASGPRASDLAALELDIDDAVRHLAESGPVRIAGASAGAYFAARACTRVSNLIERLVLCSGFVELGADARALRTQLAEKLRSGELSQPSLFAQVVDGCVPPAERSDHVETVLREQFVSEPLQSLATALDLATWCTEPVPTYSTRATLFHGGSDAFVPVEASKALALLGERSRLDILETSSHYLPLSHSGFIARAIFDSEGG
ncbi:MAG: alpha/beta hydrolase [Myxococcales bacterium]|nr:alpha/beta hydrolase [Myxococcales bacterium]MCB9583616.1 alpha/beta hydrolase [Polyangiaceae bacterium]